LEDADAKTTDRRAAQTGTASGAAECETVTSPSRTSVICVFVGDDAFIELLFVGLDRLAVDPLVPTALEAVNA
jgi:hypothetical protein